MACRRICGRCAFPVDRRYLRCRACGSRVSLLSSAGDKHWLYSVIGEVLLWHLMNRGLSLAEAWQYLIVRTEAKRLIARARRPLPAPFNRRIVLYDRDGGQSTGGDDDAEEDWFW